MRREWRVEGRLTEGRPLKESPLLSKLDVGSDTVSPRSGPSVCCLYLLNSIARPSGSGDREDGNPFVVLDATVDTKYFRLWLVEGLHPRLHFPAQIKRCLQVSALNSACAHGFRVASGHPGIQVSP